jgi:hypothetical protein
MCLLCVAVVAAGGKMTATKWHVVLAAWSISHGVLLCVAVVAAGRRMTATKWHICNIVFLLNYSFLQITNLGWGGASIRWTGELMGWAVRMYPRTYVPRYLPL